MPNRLLWAGAALATLFLRPRPRRVYAAAHTQPAPQHPPVSRRGWVNLLIVTALLVAAAAGAYAYHKSRLAIEQRAVAIGLVGGNPDNAPALLVRYGCAGCHVLSSVPQAVGNVGPALDNIARRHFVGGVLENSPENLIRWIVDPRAIDPQSAMPRTGITQEEARDVATYLYGLPS